MRDLRYPLIYGPGCLTRLTRPRRVDRSVLPLLCLGFLVLQLDRMNLASALTAGYADDIGVDQDTINLGNQLMFLGTVLFEIPSNVLLQKVFVTSSLGAPRPCPELL